MSSLEVDAGRARAVAPDIARGAMLLLIALANVGSLLYGRPTTGLTAYPVPESLSDTVLQFVMSVAVGGRALPMFAFLFGYGMVQFTRSRLACGFPERTVRRFLLRRHLALIAVGFLHAALLFTGDILGAYGLLGVLLCAVLFRRRDRTVAVWAGVFATLALIITTAMLVGGLWLNSMPQTAQAIETQRQVDADFERLIFDAIGDVPYATSVAQRVRVWLVVTLQAVFSELTISILLGWLAARRGLLDTPRRHRRVLRRIAVVGILVGWAGGLPEALAGVGSIPLRDDLEWTFLGLTYGTGVFGGIGYAAVFGLIAARLEERQVDPARPGIWRVLGAIGRRSLTFYLWQSAILAPLLSGWGLGLGRHLTTTGALGVALLVWVACIPVALHLERKGRRGPAEVVLRHLTYGRRG